MSNPNVPTINLETAFSDDHQLQLIDSACRDHGFFLIKNHGIQKEIDDMWNMSKWFFSQERKEKLKIFETKNKLLQKKILIFFKKIAIMFTV